MKVYTKSGDKGETSLMGGPRVSKSNRLIETYGEVDELNSHIGFLVSLVDQHSHAEILIPPLRNIQKELFVLGGLLATPSNQREKFKIPVMKEEWQQRLEVLIDDMESKLKPLKNFILPGGEKAAAYAHITRTVCRRVERKLIHLYEESPSEIPDHSLPYINRLSDFFFVLSRYLNKFDGVEDIIWSER